MPEDKYPLLHPNLVYKVNGFDKLNFKLKSQIMPLLKDEHLHF